MPSKRRLRVRFSLILGVLLIGGLGIFNAVTRAWIQVGIDVALIGVVVWGHWLLDRAHQRRMAELDAFFERLNHFGQ